MIHFSNSNQSLVDLDKRLSASRLLTLTILRRGANASVRTTGPAASLARILVTLIPHASARQWRGALSAIGLTWGKVSGGLMCWTPR